MYTQIRRCVQRCLIWVYTVLRMLVCVWILRELRLWYSILGSQYSTKQSWKNSEMFEAAYHQILMEFSPLFTWYLNTPRRSRFFHCANKIDYWRVRQNSQRGRVHERNSACGLNYSTYRYISNFEWSNITIMAIFDRSKLLIYLLVTVTKIHISTYNAYIYPHIRGADSYFRCSRDG